MVVSIDGGIIRINGTQGNDSVSVSFEDGNYLVDLDGDHIYEGVYAASDVSSIQVDLGSGNDSITVGNGVNINTIICGDGDDTVTNKGNINSIDGGAGDDTIKNYKTGTISTVQTGNGNDEISNQGIINSVNSGSGNDSISNNNKITNIQTGDGIDTVFNSSGSNIGTVSGQSSGSLSVTNKGMIGTASLTSNSNMNNQGIIDDVSGRGVDINYDNSGRIGSGNFRFAFRSNINNSEGSQSIRYKDSISNVVDNAMNRMESFQSTILELMDYSKMIQYFL
jgi:hypothetical protein